MRYVHEVLPLFQKHKFNNSYNLFCDSDKNFLEKNTPFEKGTATVMGGGREKKKYIL